MNNKIHFTYVVIAIALLISAGCAGKKTQTETAIADSVQGSHVRLTSQQFGHARIVLGQPTLDTVSSILRLQGRIDVPPQSIVSLSFPLGGYLKSTQLLPGMHVRKGQVLATLEDMQFIQLQQDYLLAKEKLTLSESEYVRQKALNASKASSDKVYELARAEYESNKILVSALAQKLAVIGINPKGLTTATLSKEVRIHSPIDGYVSKVNVSIGKYTSPTDNLFELIDPRDIHLALTVFEGDLNKISEGQRVVAYTNDNPENKYEARVIIGNKTLNEEHLAEIHCHFLKYAPELAPGMFMNGEVFVKAHHGLTVPEEAVVRWENKYYVFVSIGSTEFDMVEVKPGMVDHGRQQIEAAGLNEHTRVAVRNAFALLMKVRNGEE